MNTVKKINDFIADYKYFTLAVAFLIYIYFGSGSTYQVSGAYRVNTKTGVTYKYIQGEYHRIPSNSFFDPWNPR